MEADSAVVEAAFAAAIVAEESDPTTHDGAVCMEPNPNMDGGTPA